MTGLTAQSSPLNKGWLKITLRALLGGLILISFFLALTVVLFIRPSSDQPNRVDAVVVLSGDNGERLAKALELMNLGAAPTFVHAGEPDLQPTIDLCSSGAKTFEVLCLRPNPDSTRAEARAVAELSSARHWRSIAVVTSTPHVSRAGLLFRRCLDAEVKMVGAQPPLSRREKLDFVIDEWVRFLYALALQLGC